MSVSQLRFATILLYAAPMAGIGFMDIFSMMYLMKFATDVLAMPPASMGTILLASRIVGAVSDPLAGFLSDRTRSRLGRRRPWLLGLAAPLCLGFALLWSPPTALARAGLTVWMAVCVVLFQASLNFYLMPHDALGAELSDDYHDRNRIFGIRRTLFGAGSLFVFAAVAWLTSAEHARPVASGIAIAVAAVTVALMFTMAIGIRERSVRAEGSVPHPFAALADVWRNPHARLLLFVFFIQQFGIGTLAVVAAYYTQYVLGSAQALPLVLGSFFVVGIACIPLWIVLGRRFEKKPLLVASMALLCAAFGAIYFVGPGDVAALVALAAIAGAAGSAADVVFPSLEADVIDFDELRTGQRKAGTYFASWNFVAKTAQGAAAFATGSVLAASGFAPNQEQSEAATLAIRSLMSLYPFVCYGVGALLFLRFRLDRTAHAEIRAALDARHAQG